MGGRRAFAGALLAGIPLVVLVAAIVGATSRAAPPPRIDEPSDATPAGSGRATVGWVELAGSGAGSSDPTEAAANRRIAVTNAGRVLVLYGSHADGVRLAWRDRGRAHSHRSSGTTLRGQLLALTQTGDWYASSSLARDNSGTEHLWVVMSRSNFTESGQSVWLRRLSDLDSPEGPTIGPLVEVITGARSAKRADIAFETAADGTTRGAVAYAVDLGDRARELRVTWFTDLDSDEPAFMDDSLVTPVTTPHSTGVLVDGVGDLRVAAAVPPGRIAIFRHNRDVAPGAWEEELAGPPVAAGVTSLTAMAAEEGALVMAVQRDPLLARVEIHRLHPSSVPDGEVVFDGYRHPVLTGSGDDLVLTMVRVSDGAVVSRQSVDGSSWSPIDHVEIPGTVTGGNAKWPNTRVVDGRFYLLVEGRQHARSIDRSAVVFAERAMG